MVVGGLGGDEAPRSACCCRGICSGARGVRAACGGAIFLLFARFQFPPQPLDSRTARSSELCKEA